MTDTVDLRSTAPNAKAIRRLLGLMVNGTMLHFALRRLGFALPLLLMISALVFILVSIAPGDAAREILGTQATPEAYESLRDQMGLNLPLYHQYFRWLINAVSGDFGSSIYTGVPVSQSINGRVGVTLSLIICTVLVTLVVGVALGVLGAARGGAVARFLDRLGLAGFAIPSFWLGALMISWFAVSLPIFPAIGYVPLSTSVSRWAMSLILPVFVLSIGGIATLAKQTRDAMLDALGSEFVKVARANGVPMRSIIFRHALKNAGIRVTTVTSVHIIGLLGSTVVVETVFGLPGIGSLAVRASGVQDLPVVEGVVVYFTLIVVIINFLTDLTYRLLNPKVRVQ